MTAYRWIRDNAEPLRSAAFLSLHLLPFFLSAFAVIETTGSFFGESLVNPAYALLMLGTACGYLGFTLALRRGIEQRKVILSSIAVFILSTAAIFFVKNFWLHMLVVFIYTSSLGVTGAAAHWSFAMLSRGLRWSGRALGEAYAAALVVEYAIQHYAGGSQPAAQCAAIAVSLLLAVLIEPPRNWRSGAAETISSGLPGGPGKRRYILLIAIVVVMSITVGMCDGVITGLYAKNQLDVTAYPRLLYVLGILAAGCLADLRGRAFLTPATLSLLTLLVAATLFLRSPEYYAASLSAYYLYCGFYIIYITLIFTDIAPSTANPPLWAGMGRCARSFAVAPAIVSGAFAFAGWGSTAFEAVILALFALSVPLMLLREKAAAGARVTVSSAEYGFTEREAVIFRKMADPTENVRNIAASLGVSERTCRRDIASIYEKTGVKSRAGFLAAFGAPPDGGIDTLDG